MTSSHSKAPSDTTDRTCAALTVCTHEQYAAVQATLASDRTCKDLTVCKNASEYESVAPSATTDRSCAAVRAPCDNSTEFESVSPDAYQNRKCNTCSTCVFGDYIKTPCGPFADVNCQLCDECKNGGECFASVLEDFYCECPVGFVGKDCGLIDPCVQYGLDQLQLTGVHASACLHGGECIGAITNFTCDCPDSYVGERCQHPTCNPADPCMQPEHENTLSCVDDPDVGHTCLCKGGWTGTYCETREAGCSPNPCGHGDCDASEGDDGLVEVMCSCHAGYRGADCTEKITTTVTTGTGTSTTATDTTKTATTVTTTTATETSRTATTTTATTATATSRTATTTTATTVTATSVTVTTKTTITVTSVTKTSVTVTTETQTTTSATTTTEDPLLAVMRASQPTPWPTWMNWVWVGLGLLGIVFLYVAYVIASKYCCKPKGDTQQSAFARGFPGLSPDIASMGVASPSRSQPGSRPGTPYDNAATDFGPTQYAVENVAFDFNRPGPGTPQQQHQQHQAMQMQLQMGSPQQQAISSRNNSPLPAAAATVTNSHFAGHHPDLSSTVVGLSPAPPTRSPPQPPPQALVPRPPPHPLEESSFM